MRNKRKLLIEQLDQKLHPFQKTELVLVPNKGWINTIRTALNMTMAQLGAKLKITRQGAKINIGNQFYINPNRIAIPVPYFVNLSEVKHNAKKYELKDGIMYFSPDVSEIELIWKVDKKTFDNNIQDILLGYRKEHGVRWEGGRANDPTIDAETIMNSGAILHQTPAGPGFLLPEEEAFPAEPMSFELIKKAFSKEYARRFEEYTKAGKRELSLKTPYSPLEIRK